MLKKILSIAILSIMVLVSTLTAFANDPVGDIINREGFDSTKQFLVTITRPEGDEFTFKKSYVISGITDYTNIKVRLYIMNAEKKYVPFETTDGVSSWEVGSSGVFMKEVVLPNIGPNKIMVTACKNDTTPKLNSTLQANAFTVTLLNSFIRNGFGFKPIF